MSSRLQALSLRLENDALGEKVAELEAGAEVLQIFGEGEMGPMMLGGPCEVYRPGGKVLERHPEAF